MQNQGNSIVPILLILIVFLTSCATHTNSLYDDVGGQKTFEKITDNFIKEIEFNKKIFSYFKDSDVDRFHEKFIEHMCVVSGGPCQYSGDSMLDVHKGMNINESDFNLTVDLLINAMTRAGLNHRQQNRLLKQLIPMRKEIIYQ